MEDATMMDSWSLLQRYATESGFSLTDYLLNESKEVFRKRSKEALRHNLLQHAVLHREWKERHNEPMAFRIDTLATLADEADATVSEIVALSHPDFVKLSLELICTDVAEHKKLCRERAAFRIKKEEENTMALGAAATVGATATATAATVPPPGGSSVAKPGPRSPSMVANGLGAATATFSTENDTDTKHTTQCTEQATASVAAPPPGCAVTEAFLGLGTAETETSVVVGGGGGGGATVAAAAPISVSTAPNGIATKPDRRSSPIGSGLGASTTSCTTAAASLKMEDTRLSQHTDSTPGGTVLLSGAVTEACLGLGTTAEAETHRAPASVVATVATNDQIHMDCAGGASPLLLHPSASVSETSNSKHDTSHTTVSSDALNQFHHTTDAIAAAAVVGTKASIRLDDSAAETAFLKAFVKAAAAASVAPPPNESASRPDPRSSTHLGGISAKTSSASAASTLETDDMTPVERAGDASGGTVHIPDGSVIGTEASLGLATAEKETNRAPASLLATVKADDQQLVNESDSRVTCCTTASFLQTDDIKHSPRTRLAPHGAAFHPDDAVAETGASIGFGAETVTPVVDDHGAAVLAATEPPPGGSVSELDPRSSPIGNGLGALTASCTTAACGLKMEDAKHSPCTDGATGGGTVLLPRGATDALASHSLVATTNNNDQQHIDCARATTPLILHRSFNETDFSNSNRETSVAAASSLMIDVMQCSQPTEGATTGGDVATEAPIELGTAHAETHSAPVSLAASARDNDLLQMKCAGGAARLRSSGNESDTSSSMRETSRTTAASLKTDDTEYSQCTKVATVGAALLHPDGAVAEPEASMCNEVETIPIGSLFSLLETVEDNDLQHIMDCARGATFSHGSVNESPHTSNLMLETSRTTVSSDHMEHFHHTDNATGNNELISAVDATEASIGLDAETGASVGGGVGTAAAAAAVSPLGCSASKTDPRLSPMWGSLYAETSPAAAAFSLTPDDNSHSQRTGDDATGGTVLFPGVEGTEASNEPGAAERDTSSASLSVTVKDNDQQLMDYTTGGSALLRNSVNVSDISDFMGDMKICPDASLAAATEGSPFPDSIAPTGHGVLSYSCDDAQLCSEEDDRVEAKRKAAVGSPSQEMQASKKRSISEPSTTSVSAVGVQIEEQEDAAPYDTVREVVPNMEYLFFAEPHASSVAAAVAASFKMEINGEEATTNDAHNDTSPPPRPKPGSVEEKIIRILAELHALKIGCIPRDLVAFFVGYSVNSAGFTKPFASLRRAGYVAGSRGGVSLTALGVSADVVSPPQSNKEMHARLCAVLRKTKCSPKVDVIFGILTDGQPHRAVDVAREAGYTSLTSKGYGGFVAKMKAFGLVKKPGQGMIQLTDRCFPFGRD